MTRTKVSPTVSNLPFSDEITRCDGRCLGRMTGFDFPFDELFQFLYSEEILIWIYFTDCSTKIRYGPVHKTCVFCTSKVSSR